MPLNLAFWKRVVFINPQFASDILVYTEGGAPMTHEYDAENEPCRPFRLLLAGMAGEAHVEEADVSRLRRSAEAGPLLADGDVEALFAADAALRHRDDAWDAFFIASVADHVVWASRPTGVVDAAQAAWLIGCADRAATRTGFAALVAVLDEAHRVPAWFHAAVRSRVGTARQALVPTLPAEARCAG